MVLLIRYLIGWVLVLCVPLLSQGMDARISIGSQVMWNTGWNETFYFKTLTYDDVMRNRFAFDQTPQHAFFPDVRIIVGRQISPRVRTSVLLSFSQFHFAATDHIRFSWIEWFKTYDVKTTLYSVGIQGELSYKWLSPYVSCEGGLARALLTTSHFLQNPGHPEADEYVWVQGDAWRTVGDIRLGVSSRVSSTMRIVFYGGYLFAAAWNAVAEEQVRGDYKPESVFLLSSDRQILLSGPYVGIALELIAIR